MKLDTQKILNDVKLFEEGRKQGHKEMAQSCDQLLATISKIQKTLSIDKINEELDSAKVEEFVCPECKEWTDTESMCCGVSPASYSEDSLNGDR